MITFTYPAFIEILVALFIIGAVAGMWWLLNYKAP
jgi:hypothetical protein